MDNRADKVDVEDGENVDQVKDYREDEEAASSQPCHRESVVEGATWVSLQHILPCFARIVVAAICHV